MLNKKINFGIIGCGMIAKWHVDALNTIADACILGVYDINKTDAQKFASVYGLNIYDSIEDLLSDKDIDVINICTPSGLHGPLAVAVANAGKHIVVEKPMAITTEQIHEIMKACKENNVKLCSISQLRFTPAIQKTKELVQSGKLGQILCGDIYMKYHRSKEYFSTSSWRGTKAMDGGGALMNQGIHGIDLLQYIMGPVKSVFAKSKTLVHNIEVEDTLAAIVEYSSGALGVIQATTSIYPGYSRRLEINGQRGSVVLIEDSISKWDIEGEDSPEDIVLNQSAYQASNDPTAFSIDGHIHQLTDMVNAIQNDTKPFVDQYEGKKAIDIILAIYKSAEIGLPVEL